MSRMEFATNDPHERMIAGVIGVVGLMAAMVVGAVATMAASDYVGAPFITLALSLWIAASAYVKAWNRWSPWAPENKEEA